MFSLQGIDIWLMRLIVSAVLGGVVGFERQYHGRAAGLRTHMLVCMGATLITLAGILLSSDATVKTDPARVAAGVITGIGFLGGGAIIRTGDIVRGLTTAACIWFTAAVGVLVGLGHFTIASVAVVVELGTLVGLLFFEDRIPPFDYRDVIVKGRVSDWIDLESQCRRILNTRPLRVQDVETEYSRDSGEITMTFHIQIRGRDFMQRVLTSLQSLEGIRHVAWKRRS